MCTTTDVYECAEIPGHGRRYAESFAVVLSSENMQTTGSNFPWRMRDMEAYIQLPLSLLAFFAPLSRTILLAARPWGEIDKHVIHISSAPAKQPTVVILFTFTSSCVCWLLTLEMLPCAFHTRRLRDIHSHIDTIALFSAFYRYTHHPKARWIELENARTLTQSVYCTNVEPNASHFCRCSCRSFAKALCRSNRHFIE